MQIKIRTATERLQMFDDDLPQQRLADDDVFFLRAYAGEEPVAQLGHWNDGVVWWNDYFAIVPAYRGGNIRFEILNCMHHVFLQRGIFSFWFEVKKNGRVSFETFERDAERFAGIGRGTVRLIRETEWSITMERDLTQLKAAVERGDVPPITTPYRFEFVRA